MCPVPGDQVVLPSCPVIVHNVIATLIRNLFSILAAPMLILLMTELGQNKSYNIPTQYD